MMKNYPASYMGSKNLNEKEKEKIIQAATKKYGQFLSALGFDWENDVNMKDTPKRVAKSFVNDLWQGIYSQPPNITAFDNVDKYDGMVFCGNITVHSICSHHSLPFIGKAHVAYIPSEYGKIIGLSKLNRTVEWFARRPQVQENLTTQIHDYLDEIIGQNRGVAVMIEAEHLCACVRGVKHNSKMMTSKISGAFKDNQDTREEFYDFISRLDK